MFKKGVHYSPTTEFKKGIPNYARMKEPVTLICQVCGVEFKVKTYMAKTRRYCSHVCGSKGRKNRVLFKSGTYYPSSCNSSEHTVKNCKVCGKSMKLADWQKNRIFCSRECSYKGRRPSYGSPFVKGHKYNLGIKHSEERIRKISAIRKVVFANPDIRKKLSLAHKDKYPIEHYQKMGVISTLSQSKRHKSSIEDIVYKKLKEWGVEFTEQYPIDNRFVVDAYVPSSNLAIECDGDYWHSLERAIKNDSKKDSYLTLYGYRIIRLKEHHIKNGEYIKQLQEVLT